MKVGDGYQGWPEHAPFDKIIVTCSPEKVPQPLVDELSEGGRMVVPVGERYQQMLYLFTKKDGKLVAEALRPTLFVPMTGTAEAGRQVQPDPLHPHIVNGSFEEQGGTDGEPLGWFYCRQMKVLQSDEAFQGNRKMSPARRENRTCTFTNDVPGRISRALQGFAVDGKKIGRIEVSAMIHGQNIVAGPRPISCRKSRSRSTTTTGPSSVAPSPALTAALSIGSAKPNVCGFRRGPASASCTLGCWVRQGNSISTTYRSAPSLVDRSVS